MDLTRSRGHSSDWPAQARQEGCPRDRVNSSGDGNDVINGGLGTDQLLGGNDNDTIRAKDGNAESINWGADSDQVDPDTVDTHTNCEGPTAPAVGIGPKRARIDDKGRVRLTLHCWATAARRCTGTLRLKHRGAGTIASRRFTVASGDTATVRCGSTAALAARSRPRTSCACARSRARPTAPGTSGPPSAP